MKRMYKRNKPELLKPLMKAITKKWFLHRYFIDVNTYKQLFPEKISYIYQESIQLYYSSIKFYNSKLHPLLKETPGFKYAAVIEDTEVIGGSSVIILDEQYVLYDLKYALNNTNTDFTDEAIQYYNNDKIVMDANNIDGYFKNAITLINNYSSNYYHFVLEVIAKFEVLSKLSIPTEVPLLIDNICLHVPQFRQAIELFNKDHREIKWVKKGLRYKVEFLYHIKCPNIIPPNYHQILKIKANHNLFDFTTLEFVRKNVLKKLPKDYKGYKRIFLSRKNASARRTYNEEDVIKLVEKYNFSIIYVEEKSLEEQAAIFNEAELILGPTGAAFTNMIFCKSTCKIICFTNYAIDLSIFSTIANLIGIDMQYIYDKTLTLDSNSNIHSSFNIDLLQLEEALRQIIHDK